MKKSIVVLVLICICIILNSKEVYGANAEIVVDSETKEVTTDEIITVSINIDADISIKKADATFEYDKNMLKFEEGGSYVALEKEGVLKLHDSSVYGGKKRNYSVKFKTLKSGIVKIGCDETPSILSSSGSTMKTSVKEVYIEIKGVDVEDSDSSLKSLKISPGKLDKEFKTTKTSYKADISYDSSEIVVFAEATSDKASIKISGNENLKIGTNKVRILVVAEDNSETEYTIDVNRMSQDEQLRLDRKNYITIKKDKGNVYTENDIIYIINDSEYEILPIKEIDNMELPKGYQKAKMNLYGTNIDICVMNTDPQNDMFLIYARNTESGDKGYYQYDKVERTLQRYRGKTYLYGDEKNKKTTEDSEYNEKLKILGIIIGILSVIVVISVGFAVKMMMDIRNIKNDNYLI